MIYDLFILILLSCSCSAAVGNGLGAVHPSHHATHLIPRRSGFLPGTDMAAERKPIQAEDHVTRARRACSCLAMGRFGLPPMPSRKNPATCETERGQTDATMAAGRVPMVAPSFPAEEHVTWTRRLQFKGGNGDLHSAGAVEPFETNKVYACFDAKEWKGKWEKQRRKANQTDVHAMEAFALDEEDLNSRPIGFWIGYHAASITHSLPQTASEHAIDSADCDAALENLFDCIEFL